MTSPPGRERAFTEFYDRERVSLFRFAAVMSPHLDHESAVQDAFIIAWREWDSISPASRRAWMIKVIRNLLVDLARKRERPGVLTEWQAGSYRLLVQRQRDPEDWQELTTTLSAIGSLPERLRTALAMRFWKFDDDEIAEVLGCDRSTVRRYVSQARAQVSQLVGNQERRARRPRKGNS